MIDRERMEAYYTAFNRGDHTALAAFYTEDLVFEYQDIKLSSRDAVISYFVELQKGFKETIRPVNIVIDGDKVAVEVDDDFVAKVDLPDFLGQSLKAGDSFKAKFSGFYDIRGDRICHMRLYQF